MGIAALVPAIIGLILGIVDTVQKNKKGEKKGISIAGIVLSTIAVAIILVWTLVIGNAVKNTDLNELEKSLTEWNEFYSNYDFGNLEDYE